MISLQNFITAVFATWLISAIIFMIGERAFESGPESMRNRIYKTLLWPVPATLMIIGLILELMLSIVEVLLDPWIDEDDDDDSQGGAPA